MKIKELINLLLEFDLNMEVNISAHWEQHDVKEMSLAVHNNELYIKGDIGNG